MYIKHLLQLPNHWLNILHLCHKNNCVYISSVNIKPALYYERRILEVDDWRDVIANCVIIVLQENYLNV